MSEEKKHIEDEIEATKAKIGSPTKPIQGIRITEEIKLLLRSNRKRKEQIELNIQSFSEDSDLSLRDEKIKAAKKQISQLDLDYNFWNDILEGKVQSELASLAADNAISMQRFQAVVASSRALETKLTHKEELITQLEQELATSRKQNITLNTELTERSRKQSESLLQEMDALNSRFSAAQNTSLRQTLKLQEQQAQIKELSVLKAKYDTTLSHLSQVEGEVETLRQERSQTQSQMESLKSELETSNSKYERGVAEIRFQHEEALSMTTAEIERLKREIHQKTADNKKIQDELNRSTDDNENLRKLLERNKQNEKEAIATLEFEKTNAHERMSELAKKTAMQIGKIAALERDLHTSAQDLKKAQGYIHILQAETHTQAEEINKLRFDLGNSQETVRQNTEATQALESIVSKKDREIEKLQEARASLITQMQEKDKQMASMLTEHTQQITRLQVEHEETSIVARTEIERLKSETHQKTIDNKKIEREVTQLADENTGLRDLLNRTKQNAKEEIDSLKLKQTDTLEIIRTLAKKTAMQTGEIEQLKHAVNNARNLLGTSEEANGALQRENHTLSSKTESLRLQFHQAQANEAEAQSKITEIVRQAQMQDAENQAKIQEAMREIENFRQAIRGKDQEIAEVRLQIRENQENMERAHRVAQENSEREIAQLKGQLAQSQQAEQLANLNNLAATEEAQRNIAALTEQLQATQHALVIANAPAGAGQQATPYSGTNPAVAAARERFKNK